MGLKRDEKRVTLKEEKLKDESFVLEGHVPEILASVCLLIMVLCL